MSDQSNKFIYSISIYYWNNQFYITPMVRKPPGASVQVLPLYTVSEKDLEGLIESIELAKLGSDARYPSNREVLDRKEWDGEKENVWNKAQMSWSIYWNENGLIEIFAAKPYIKHKNGMEWINVLEKKKKLLPPIFPQDIAQEIMNQL